MSLPAGDRHDGLLALLRPLVGEAGISTDAAACALAGVDLLPGQAAVTPELVIRPRNTEETSRVLQILAEHGRAVVPRGAGLSYTGGVVPTTPTVAIDTGAMTEIQIDTEDMTAVVGAGCTWEALVDRLRPSGLRPAVEAPISGSHSTIGGAASQGVSGSEGIIGLAVVLADGTVARTGSWTTPGGNPFWRHYGPDLTGLFLGDCGAFGIKTQIVLRLLPPSVSCFASFGFRLGSDVVDAMASLQRGPAGKALAFDRARAESAASGMGKGEALRTAAAVASRAGSLVQAVQDVIGLRRGAASLEEAPWSLHLTAEGCTSAHADAHLDAMRRVCIDAGGSEMPPAVPQALAARPFSVRGMVGPEGERWVPVHGNLPLSAAAGCFAAIEALFAERGDAIRRHGVRINWLLSATGAMITMEPMFYWRDALDSLHLFYLSKRNRARFSNFTADPSARGFVSDLRAAVRDIMDRHGAAHGQIGRFYKPPAGDLLGRIKTVLDPQHRMNPGVIGL